MKALFLIILVIIGARASSEPVYNSKASNSLQRIQSNEWSCRYIQKNIVKGPADLKHVTSVCSASVYCTGVAGEPLEKKLGARSILICSATSRNTCPNIEECAIESASEFGPVSADNAALLKTETNQSLSDGRKCEYHSKTSSAILFWPNDGKPAGHFCTQNAYCTSPNGAKTETLSLCRAVQVNQDGEATRYACPKANDCLSNHIGTPGYTEQELAQMEKHQARSASPANHRP